MWGREENRLANRTEQGVECHIRTGESWVQIHLSAMKLSECHWACPFQSQGIVQVAWRSGHFLLPTHFSPKLLHHQLRSAAAPMGCMLHPTEQEGVVVTRQPRREIKFLYFLFSYRCGSWLRTGNMNITHIAATKFYPKTPLRHWYKHKSSGCLHREPFDLFYWLQEPFHELLFFKSTLWIFFR